MYFRNKTIETMIPSMVVHNRFTCHCCFMETFSMSRALHHSYDIIYTEITFKSSQIKKNYFEYYQTDSVLQC